MENVSNRLCYIFTDYFSAFDTSIKQVKKLVKLKYNVIPVMSEYVYSTDSRYTKAKEINEKINTAIGENKIIHTMSEIEKLEYKNMFDIIVIAPANGNVIAKLANNIFDSVDTVAVKVGLKNNNPIILGIATNDGLRGNAENIGKLLNRKNFYFVPFRQDNPITKPFSLVCDFNMISKTIQMAFVGEQIQPILL